MTAKTGSFYNLLMIYCNQIFGRGISWEGAEHWRCFNNSSFRLFVTGICWLANHMETGFVSLDFWYDERQLKQTQQVESDAKGIPLSASKQVSLAEQLLDSDLYISWQQ